MKAALIEVQAMFIVTLITKIDEHYKVKQHCSGQCLNEDCLCIITLVNDLTGRNMV
jgi:hypothetical protein